MGRRGPPKLPAKTLKSRKTFRRDRHSDDFDEPEIAAAAKPVVPPAPKHLNALEKKTWNAIGDLLAAKGLLTSLDTIALELLVQSYSQMRDAAARIDPDQMIFPVGDAGALQAHPLIGVVHKNANLLVKMLREFGCTPSARTAIRLPDGKPAADPMAALLAEA